MSGTAAQLAAGWNAWILPLAWQSLALTCLALLLDRWLHRRIWPQLLQALWLLVLAKHLVSPHWHLPGALAAHLPRAATGVPASGSVPGSWSWLLPVVALLSLVLSEAAHHLLRRRIRSGATPPPGELEEIFRRAQARLGLDGWPGLLRPRLVISTVLPSPAVVGLLRPVVALPPALRDRMTDEELEHVLLHELAHVRRGDLLVQRLFLWVHCAFWFQPLLGWVRRRAQAARELGCDATVAGLLGGQARRYPRTLLRAAGLILPVSPGLAGLLERGSSTLTRLDWLDRGSFRGRRRRRFAALVAFAAAAALLLPAAPEPKPLATARRNLEAAVASGSSLQIRYAFEQWRAASSPPSTTEDPEESP